MRVLVATGRCAERIVKESVGQAADVLILDIDVAALMTPPLLKKAYVEHIKKLAREYDMILIPGSSNAAGFRSLAEELNTNIVPVSYTHLRAHETVLDLVCRLLLE